MKQITKKRNQSRIVASIIVGIGTDEDGKEINAKIIFVQDNKDKGSKDIHFFN